MQIENFDYYLPPKCIAQFPLEKRDNSRLMVLHRNCKQIEHRKFFELPDYLQEGDLLVLNNTKVIPARLHGRKETGGKVEVLLLSKYNGIGESWECLIKSHKSIKPLQKLYFDSCLKGEVSEKLDEERFLIKFFSDENLENILEKIGSTPLPPYIKRKENNNGFDRNCYQTVYAEKKGAVAAPTAGLHFTETLLNKIRQKGINICFITLHVGWGTFQPLRVERIEDHKMHAEEYEIEERAAFLINQTKERGGRIIAVGTTTVRTLEFATSKGKVHSGKGKCDLFIYPGYQFRTVDALITNFHLPRSTLILLVSAFATRDFLFCAYQEAIKKGYRFYSYGDAMMIL